MGQFIFILTLLYVDKHIHTNTHTHTHTFLQKKGKPELTNNFTCSLSCKQNSYTGLE